MSAIVVGISGPKVGVTTESWGYIESTERTANVQKEILTDEDGDIVNYAFTQPEAQVTCSYQIKDSGYPDEGLLGTVLELADSDLGGDAIYVTEATQNKSKAPGWFSGSFSGYFVPGVSWTTTTT